MPDPVARLHLPYRIKCVLELDDNAGGAEQQGDDADHRRNDAFLPLRRTGKHCLNGLGARFARGVLPIAR